MKKLAIAVVGLVALSGCVNYSTPEATLATALHALQTHDAKRFDRSLTGPALTEYGTLAAMGQLQSQLSGLDLDLGKTELTHVAVNAFGMDIERTYSVEVLARPLNDKSADFLPALDATVLCEVNYLYVPPRWDMPNHEFMDCRISDLRSAR